MNTVLFLTVFVAINVLYLILGAWSSSGIKDNDDYFLAGRTLGPMALTMTLVATQLGSNFLLVSSTGAYRSGLWGLAYPLGMSFGFLILGLGFASKLRSFNVGTTAQLFETIYKSRLLRKVASIISIASLWGILLSLVIASKILLASMGICNPIILLLFWATLIVYTVMGGFKAVVLTDIYQVMMIVIVFAGLWGFSVFTDLFNGITLPFIATNITFDSQTFSYARILSLFIAPAMFSLIEQDLAQRFFSARTKKIAVISALSASLFLIIFSLIPIYFGMKARALGLHVSASQNPLIEVMNLISHPLIAVLGLCAIAAALTSTADSILCAVSSHAAQDFSDSKKGVGITTSRIITFIVGISALGASYVVGSGIEKVLVSSYQFAIATLFIPLFACFFIAKPSKKSAFFAMTFGALGFVFSPNLCAWLPVEVPSLVASGIGFALGFIL
jgi:solute:Na+ symporter, SSS family